MGVAQNISWEGATPAARLYLSYVRRVPDHPLKLRITRNLGARLFSKGLPVSGPTGGTVLLDLTKLDFIFNEIVHTGSWEPKSLRLAMQLMANGGTFLDVGSHCGLYTCVVGLLPDVECICIEPSPETFVRLHQNVARNKLKATLVHAAVSSAQGLVQFDTPCERNSGGSRVVLETDEINQSRFYVPCLPLKSILEQLKPKPIRLMKIDVEGHEVHVFEGMDWWGPYRPDNVIAEFDPNMLKRANTTSDRFLQYFCKQGYEALSIDGSRFNPLAPPQEWNVWFRTRSEGAGA